MVLRYVEICAALLIVALGFGALFHQQDLYSVAVFPLLVFLRGLIWRLGLRKGLVFLIIPFIPFALRHRGRRNLSRFGAHCHAVGRLLRRRWQRLPRRFRLVVAVAVAPLFLLGGTVALFAGGTLGVLAFLVPFRFTTFTFLGEWVQTRGLPSLARAAAGRGLHGLFFPVLSEILPAGTRNWIRHRYRRLWWETMRRLVKDRKALGRRAARLVKQRRRSAAASVGAARATPR